MRLLNTTSLKLHYFVADVPAYAILSHTWANDEVLFDDIDKPHVTSMGGYNKIFRCCERARNDGFEWTWIDTCCIDKSSSAELSEAINSMYRWYWEATTCYAYLEDVADTHQLPQDCLPESAAGRISVEDNPLGTRQTGSPRRQTRRQKHQPLQTLLGRVNEDPS